MNCSGASSFSNPPDPKAMRRFLEGVELRSVVVCSDCSLVGEHSLDLCLGRPPVVLHKEDACRSSWSARVGEDPLKTARAITID